VANFKHYYQGQKSDDLKKKVIQLRKSTHVTAAIALSRLGYASCAKRYQTFTAIIKEETLNDGDALEDGLCPTARRTTIA